MTNNNQPHEEGDQATISKHHGQHGQAESGVNLYSKRATSEHQGGRRAAAYA